jgi:hypothetical protein
MVQGADGLQTILLMGFDVLWKTLCWQLQSFVTVLPICVLTSVVIGRPSTKPQAQLKKVIVVSHDFRVATLMAIMPVMMQCQMHSCQQYLTMY